VLDITNNALVIDYIGSSPVDMVRTSVLSGRGGPGFGSTWTGKGITSSTAAHANANEPETWSVGFAENAALPLGPYSTFHGLSVNDTAVLVAFTRTGDANLDGRVNDDDVTILGATYSPGVVQPSWALGDFDYNGLIDDDDVTLLGVFYDPAASFGAPALIVEEATSAVEQAISEDNSLVELLAQAVAAERSAQYNSHFGDRRLAIHPIFFNGAGLVPEARDTWNGPLALSTLPTCQNAQDHNSP
jgi:hypothetical protein